MFKSLISTFRISSRKFYDIVAQKRERIIPMTPEESIISKYLKQQYNFNEKSNASSIKSNQKSTDHVKNVNYQNIIQKNPHGSVIQKNYKEVNFNMISLNFKNIDLRDIYNVCEKYQPDLVLLQGRPQNYLSSFQIIKKKNGVFSDKLYLQQLVVQSNKIKKLLGSQLQAKLKQIAQSQAQKEIKDINNQKVFIQDYRAIVDDSVLLMACNYAAQNNKDVLFGDLPQQPWRQWICNSHTLMQIQQIYKHITKNIPFYQSLNLSPEQLGCLLKPQLFLNLRDRYMATLIEMIIASKKYKKVLSLTGVMQNESIVQILDNQLLFRLNDKTKQEEFTPILQYLIGPPIKSSILKNIQGWQIIQKHIIFDVLHYGEQIMNLPVETFSITNKMIQRYGVQINSYDEENIMKFRFEKTSSYINLMRSQIKEGQELKKKFMLRQAIRANQEDDE